MLRKWAAVVGSVGTEPIGPPVRQFSQVSSVWKKPAFIILTPPFGLTRPSPLSPSLLLLSPGNVFILPACLASLGSRCTWFCERVHPALAAAELQPSLALVPSPLLFDREHSVIYLFFIFFVSVLFLCFLCLFNFCSFCVLWSSASNVSSTCCYPPTLLSFHSHLQSSSKVSKPPTLPLE